MGQIKDLLKDRYGFSKVERATVYTLPVIGVLTPIALTRATLTNPTHSPIIEAVYLGISAGLALPFPIYGGLAGLVIGPFAAFGLKQKRLKREAKQNLKRPVTE